MSKTENGTHGSHGFERTEAQRAALRDAYKLLTDHFEHILIVAAMEEDQGGPGAEMDVYWKGGYLAANGMADFAKERISHRKRFNFKPT